MKIYITSDHGGFELKQKIIEKLKVDFEDLGPFNFNPEDDYPKYVKILAEKIETNLDCLGIIICRNGVGVSMAINKYKHIRCGLGINKFQIKSARNDDNINTLALAADYTSLESCLEMSFAFISTPFSQEKRHIRRVEEINQLI